MQESQIFFKFVVDTLPGQHVRIVGDISQLGVWNPSKGLSLTTNPKLYPYWISLTPIIVPKDTKILFKCIIMQNESCVQWEELSNNRKYKCKHKKVVLRGVFNDYKGSEQVESEFEEGTLKIENVKNILSRTDNYNPILSASKTESDEDMSADIFSARDFKFPLDKETKDFFKEQRKRKNTIEIAHNEESESSSESENEELDDISKIKNIVNISTNQKNYLDEYKTFSSKLKAMSPMEKKSSNGEAVVFEKDSIFQSYFKQMKETNQLRSKYTMLNSNNDIMYELNQDVILHLDESIPVIMASLFLPISVKINEEGDWEINTSLSNFKSMLYDLLNNSFNLEKNKKNFKWAGLVPVQSNKNFNAEKEQKLVFELENKYNCLAILIDEEKIQDFVKNFCLKYFENIISNIVEEDYSQVFNYSEEMWSYFKEINKLIAGKIVETLEENTLVYILDYRIFLTIGMISYTSPKTSIAFYWNQSFPTLENFKYMPFKHELLLSILCANVICFIDFRYARSFFSVVKSFLGLDYQTKRGVLYIQYLGRQIIIKISNLLPDIYTIRNLQNRKEYKLAVQKWKEQINGYQVILSINSLDLLNLTILKLELIQEFLIANKDTFKVKFIQIIQRESYDDIIEYNNNRDSINELFKRKEDLNNLLGGQVFEIIDDTLSIYDHLALMSLSQVFLRAQIKPKNLFICLEYLLVKPENSVIMISEFACYSKICKSFLTFNLFKTNDFSSKLKEVFQNNDSETQKCNYLLDLEYFKENTTTSWLNSCLLDLTQTANMIKYAQISSIAMGTQYLKVLTNKRFKHLDYKLTLNNYLKKNTNRLILLDIDGTLLPQDKYTHFESKKNKLSAKFFQTPEESVIKNLRLLTNDISNTVFLVTGKSCDDLSSQFKSIPQLGVACEYGYLLKDCGYKTWAKLFQPDLSWKEQAKQIIEKYVENIELSSMEDKVSGMVWKYGDVDKELGAKQCDQLYKELKTKFENNSDIDIVISKDYLEVRPFGMNKGTFTEILIKKNFEEKGKIDFILIIGNGLSDEEMFVAAKKSIKLNPERFAPKIIPYLCVVGKRPSNAFYYVKDHLEVTHLIENFVKE